MDHVPQAAKGGDKRVLQSRLIHLNFADLKFG